MMLVNLIKLIFNPWYYHKKIIIFIKELGEISKLFYKRFNSFEY